MNLSFSLSFDPFFFLFFFRFAFVSSLEPVSHLPARARRRISHDAFTNIRTDASRARKPASDRRHERVPASSSTARNTNNPSLPPRFSRRTRIPRTDRTRYCTLGYLCAFRVYLATGDKQISRARRTHPVVSLSFTPTPGRRTLSYLSLFLSLACSPARFLSYCRCLFCRLKDLPADDLSFPRSLSLV